MSLPERKLSKVVFPEPEGPNMAVKVDGSMRPCCLCKIVLVSVFILAWMRAS